MANPPDDAETPAATSDARGLDRLELELSGFSNTAVTVRLLDGLMRVLPGAPPLPPYDSLESAADAVVGRVPEDVLGRAEELADDPRIDQALFAARSIDTGDTGLAIVSGVRSALSLFLGADKAKAGIAQQQTMDAALKALGLAYLLTRLIPLDAEARVELVQTIPAGQEMLLYYGAIEIALPFSEQVIEADGTFVRDLVHRHGHSMTRRLLGIVGREGVRDAEEMLTELTGVLDAAALHCAPHTDALATQVRSLMPRAIPGASLTDLVAAGADALPCYRYLCARLAAEACLARAKLECMPDVDLPDLAAAAPVAVVPPPPPVPAALLAATAGLGAPQPPRPQVRDAPDDEADVREPAEPAEPASTSPAAVPPSRWPTEELPPESRLRGVFVEDGADEPRWLVFTKEGVFANGPPVTPPPVDWDTLQVGGHVVATYRRDGDTVTIDLDAGPVTSTIEQHAYTLILDGVACRRADFDLGGRSLHGTWIHPDTRELLVLRHDGSGSRAEHPLSYELGVARIRIDDGQYAADLTLFSCLRPTARQPSTLWIGGQRWDLVGDPTG